MTDQFIRVRIAPSPTGYFHVGTARTAIFNWLFARRMKGKFIVRIEDTDVERSKPEYVDVILNGLRWLGMDWDDEIVYQSRRLGVYKPFADRLLSTGKAYRCFCTAEELAAKRAAAQERKEDYHYDRKCRNLDDTSVRKYIEAGMPSTIRLKLPTLGIASFDDAILGKIEKAYADLDDLIILKSDGNAVYNFAVVVDDHEMAISHVIRGNDHISNTFLQQDIYRALDWQPPIFAHIPLILRMDKSKVSKRKGDRSVDEYQTLGYLPEAMFNFLALLGWSPKDNREKMSKEEIISAFSLEGINRTNAIFNPEKLNWLNGQYIMEKSDHQLAELVAPLLVEVGITTKYYLETRWQWLMKIMNLLKERCKLLTDFVESSRYFFEAPKTYDEQGVRKFFAAEAAQHLTELARRFSQLSDFSEMAIDKTLRDYAEELGGKPAKLIHPTRLAVTGSTGGPSLFALLETIGRDQVVQRLRKAAEYVELSRNIHT